MASPCRPFQVLTICTCHQEKEDGYEVSVHGINNEGQFIPIKWGISMSDLFPAKTYCKLCKIIS